MPALRKVGAFVTLLLVLSVPATACLEQGDMTAAERACCRQMADDCGSMAMPQSHSCCTTNVQANSAPAIVRNSSPFAPPLAALGALDLVIAANPIASPGVQWLVVGSPPVSPPQSTTILRI